MGRHKRATVGVKAERHAKQVAARLGKALRDGRLAVRLTQSQAATRAGIAQSTWSRLENDADPCFTLATWDRAAFAVGASIEAYLRGASAADLPRDSIHLRNQELIIRSAVPGGWRPLPEELIDREARTSRAADVLLHRRRHLQPAEYALMEVIDWFDDVGAPIRDWGRRLAAVERYAIARMVGDEPLPQASGCWVVRATQRNRRLIREHANFFRGRFAGSGREWLSALTDPGTHIPTEPALIWVSVGGDRLFSARLGRE